MKLFETYKEVIREQSFYPKGCRPSYEETHGFNTSDTNVNHIKKDFKFSTSSYWIKKYLPEYQKKLRKDGEYKNAQEDLYRSMDSESRAIYDKLANENHPLYYGLPGLFANNARSAVESYRPSGYGSTSTSRITDYKVKLSNWITKLSDIGNGDYSWTFEFDRIFKTKGVN